ncbi:helix-hairpin-helix domain-containing protein [Alteromonadaceae bacterium BrNp21-10]|nr:helix-hairpin-helix domain-containing protein [Alteromonadaceae bacterium BrNp21-10]
MKKALSYILLVIVLACSFTVVADGQLAEAKAAASKMAAININTASAKELMKLPGIGKTKAEAIVAYREKNGNFMSLDDLTNVEGVGKKVVKSLQGKVDL